MAPQYVKKGETQVYTAISELKEMIAGALVWLPRFFIESNARNRFVQKGDGHEQDHLCRKLCKSGVAGGMETGR